MPISVKKFFYLEFLHKTFYEALMRSSINATNKYGESVKKHQKVITSQKKEILAYFKELL
jgi:hypothetical protein